MATQDHEVTGAPTDIVAAPATDTPAHIFVSRESFTVHPVAGEGIYLWSVAGGPAVVVVTEAA